MSKIAIVTGGSRGLGRNTVLSLAPRGVDSILTYRANETEATSAVAAVEAAGARAVALRLDVGDSSSFDGFVKGVEDALRTLGAERFDYLVNNAGDALYKPFAETTEEELNRVYRVHLKGPYFLTQKLLPLMNDGGRIVNVSSGLARFSFPGSSGYAVMKGGLEVLTRYLAKELGPRGIAANTVAPGAIATDFGGGRTRDTPEIGRMVASATALGRVGEPDDIGPMIAALLSEDNRWVNGQRIEVSGGMML